MKRDIELAHLDEWKSEYERVQGELKLNIIWQLSNVTVLALCMVQQLGWQN